jgi:anti-anti-sigma factor
MRKDGFRIRVEWADETVFLRLSGELDIAVTEELEGSVKAVAGSSARRVVLDLSGLDFMDSSGLRALLRAQEAVGSNGRSFVLADPAPAVQRVLDVTGAGRLLDRVAPGDGVASPV